jgi:hypothetical protein
MITVSGLLISCAAALASRTTGVIGSAPAAGSMGRGFERRFRLSVRTPSAPFGFIWPSSWV